MQTKLDAYLAIITPPGISGIAVVRVAGKDAPHLCDQIFHAYSRNKIVDLDGYVALFGKIIDPHLKLTIDQAIALRFVAPKSYTGEDIVELSVHGGMMSIKKVVALLLSLGARVAAPGEFTQKAFLNGKMDLTQAEAVMDMIHADSSNMQSVAMNQLNGGLSKEISTILDVIFSILAELEMGIEYPEHEDSQPDMVHVKNRLVNIQEQLMRYLQSSRQGEILKKGLQVVLIGKPNVGKSSLLNRLSRSERSIVTNIAGTTRDIVDVQTEIEGVLVCLTDTAGIRQTTDEVEKNRCK